MRVGLFIPCYINQYYPQVGIASFKLLKKLGFDVEYPTAQTCCGQPLGNSGFERHTHDAIEHFQKLFGKYDRIVSPSGSCTLFVKEHPKYKLSEGQKIMELSELLYEQNIRDFSKVTFAKRVGILQSCHGLRGLGLGNASEYSSRSGSTVRVLLNKVRDIKLVDLSRNDDCCGFGGTFSVKESALSAKMGRDRIDDFKWNKAEVITGTDMSCLMHLQGIINKKKIPIEIMHFSQILLAS